MWSIVKVNMLGWKNGKRDFRYVEASLKRYKTDRSAKAAFKRMNVPMDTRMADQGEYWTICQVDDNHPHGFEIILNHEERIFVELPGLKFVYTV
jgi:hypothetical protein